MRWMFSLRTRLIVFYVGLFLIGFGTLGYWAGQQISIAAQDDFERRTESEVSLVSDGLTGPVEHLVEGETTRENVATILDNYAEQTKGELYLINNQGDAWLSTKDPSPDDTYLDKAEVIAALDDRITHETRRNADGELMIYTAASLKEDGRIISIVQLAIPASEVEEEIRQRWITLGVSVGILGLLVIVTSILISASLTSPLAKLQHATERIAEGDFAISLSEKRRDEIGRVARAFNVMSRRVQMMIEEQKSFASNASHELRTPLTTIRLRTEALLNKPLPEDKKLQYITEIDSEVKRMAHLVDSLLILSRLDAGSVEIGNNVIDVVRVANQVVREMRPVAEQHLIEITLDAPTMALNVQADLNHLYIVFRNIIENAMKYMGERGGQISWKMETENGYVVSTIKDTGRGISNEDLQRVTERFYRADKAHSRDIGGVGLGLSLVKSILEIYGGKFNLQSDGLGRGVTVTIHWKLETLIEL